MTISADSSLLQTESSELVHSVTLSQTESSELVHSVTLSQLENPPVRAGSIVARIQF